MKRMTFYLMSLVVVFLTACGGSGSSSDTTNNSDNSPDNSSGDGSGNDSGDGSGDDSGNGSGNDSGDGSGDDSGNDSGDGSGDDSGNGNDLPNPDDAVALAVQTGDASLLDSDKQILELAITTLQTYEQTTDTLAKLIYQTDAIDFAPGKNSNWIMSNDIENNISLIVGNNGKSLASAGENGGRYAAFGSDIVQNHGDYAPTFSRLMNWLVHGDITLPTSPITIAIAEYPSADIPTVFDTYFNDVNYLTCSTAAELSACATTADLIVLGGQGDDDEAEDLQLAVQNFLQQGKGLLYSHTQSWSESDSGQSILAAINMQFGPYGGNYWDNDAANWSDVDSMLENNSLIAVLKAPLLHLRDDTFSFDYSACTTYVGKVDCSEITDIETEFLAGARLLKNFLNNLDKNNISLFSRPDNLAWKYMTLYSDKVRSQIQYPMDKSNSQQDQFYSALYADHGVHYHRDINGIQADLGTFSSTLDPAEIPTIDKDVIVEVTKDGGFTALGLYVLPGQVFTVSRGNELSGEKLWLKINTQRTGSSRYWNTNQYDRPAFLQSVKIPLLEGQVQTLTTPYGGTLQLVSEARAAATNITINATNVVQHAVMANIQLGQEYIAELSDNPINWTEIKTPLIQIHSLSSKMLAALNDSDYAGDIVKFFDDIDQYTIKSSYNLAGFTADGLTLNTSVIDFCNAHSWLCVDTDLHGKPALQHINIDQYAHCGGGCSGNPYDQSWNLDPLGWGESHEIGHNLQRNRLKINSDRSNEVSNQIFPIYKNVLWQQNTGESLEPDRSKYESVFEMLKSASLTEDPREKANELIWQPSGVYDNNGERIAFFMQLVHINEATGFNSPWDVFTLSYLLERQFTAYIKDDVLWQANKDKLGFSTYSSAPTDISGNDFMLLAHSFIAKQDLRPIWDLWGIYYSSEVSHQLDIHDFPVADKVFYYSDDTNTLSIGSITITPIAIWPLSIP